MLTKKQITGTTAAIFTLAALVHLARLLLGWSFVVEGYDLPLWLSGLAVIAIGFLAYENWQLFAKEK